MLTQVCTQGFSVAHSFTSVESQSIYITDHSHTKISTLTREEKKHTGNKSYYHWETRPTATKKLHPGPIGLRSQTPEMFTEEPRAPSICPSGLMRWGEWKQRVYTSYAGTHRYAHTPPKKATLQRPATGISKRYLLCPVSYYTAFPMSSSLTPADFDISGTQITVTILIITLLLVWTELLSPNPQVHVGVLTPRAMVFGDGALASN